LSADGSKLIAGVANASSVSPVFFSTNSGSTWVQAKLPTNVNWSAVACSADGSKWMAANLPTVESVPPFILPGALYLSLDQGATWKSNNLPSISWHGVALSADGGKAVAMAQNGAVYTSTDQGTNWTSSTVPAQPCWAIASSADANRLVVAIDFVSSSTGGGIYISQTTNSPVLQIAAADNQAILSWLIPSTKFLLQQSPDLISWSTVTNKPVLNLSSLQDQVTLPSSAASDFFRLRTP
jgi:photosystem II stability/assembly factor-like uncharacterized protein